MKKSCIALMCLAVAWSSCSGGSTSAGKDEGSGVEEVTTKDVAADTTDTPVPVDVVETSRGDETFDEIWPETTELDTLEPACDPGMGCFLDKCTSNTDCQSGWCVQHMGEGICSKACQEECPEGWDCKQVAGTDPDVVFICVSNFANLCRPCADGDACNSSGEATDACIDYGDEGAFCGGKCGENGDCPWGFSCKDSVTVDGVELQQCVNDAGVCPCTDSSVALGLWTPCEIDNEFGACAGKRICDKDGLGACDAQVPEIESCNGLDDDCDGETDEPALVGGDYVNLCQDDNDCTEDTCSGTEGCLNTPFEAASCDDGNPCSAADHCEDGQCLSQLVECEDNNECTDNVCTETGGCEFPPVVGPCDDGDPCTLADQCDGGECNGTPVACDCQTDADCLALEDGNLCNGTLICDALQVPFKCVVDPGTEVVCPEPLGEGAFCLQPHCDPPTSECSMIPAHEGLLCDNSDPCTANDKCGQGVCEGGTDVNCNDGNPCTADSCEPGVGCAYEDLDVPCDDGNVCTIDDVCDGGQCVGGPGLDCDDQNVCTDDSCEEGTGCHHTANQAVCDDGNSCTIDDHCVAGQCVAGGMADCDDLDPCTADSCVPETGCAHEAAQGPCDDGDPCTIGDACKAGECASGPPVDCDDGNVCTDDACSAPLGKCEHTASDNQCDDGNECTTGDLCQDGTCGFTGLLDCDDDNVCTDNICDPGVGCIDLLNQAPCDDANECTLGDQCALGECAGTGDLVCNDNNPCTDDSCQPGVGCEFVPNAGECDDGNACTAGDHCDAGWCVSSEMADCNDNNICTDDTCKPALGCVYTANANPCDDGNFCTVGDVCDQNVCSPGAQTPCSDGAFCNGEETCDPDLGCVAGTPPDLDDQVACTVDYCDEDIQQVVHDPNDDACPAAGLCEAAGCDSELGCGLETVADCCGNLLTEDGEECDDGNEVNTDACVGCLNAFCGDGVRWHGEEDCEGEDLEITLCADLLGQDFSGELACDDLCEYDTTGCIGPIGTESNPALSCKAILDAGDSTGDGAYFLTAGEATVKAYCDMVGGGWTLVTSWPRAQTEGVWGEWHLAVDDPAPGIKHALPFRSVFAHPAQAKMTYMGNSQSLTFDIVANADWAVDGDGTRIPVPGGKFLVFGTKHCGPSQGICVHIGSYGTGFNCDGDAGQVSGQGIYDECTYNEFCNCNTYGWKYSAGGCSATVCGATDHLAVYLR